MLALKIAFLILGPILIAHEAAAILSQDEYEKLAVNEMNKLRKNHGAEALQIDEELSDYAREWAAHLARTGTMHHRPRRRLGGETVGETIYARRSGELASPTDGVEKWYGEIANYDWDQPGRGGGTVAHFAQLVWKDTKRVGCGYAVKKDSAETKTIVVCNYSPSGAVKSRGGRLYAANVQPASETQGRRALIEDVDNPASISDESGEDILEDGSDDGDDNSADDAEETIDEPRAIHRGFLKY